MSQPPFLDQLRHDLLVGLGQYQQRRRRRSVAAVALLIGILGLGSAFALREMGTAIEAGEDLTSVTSTAEASTGSTLPTATNQPPPPGLSDDCLPAEPSTASSQLEQRFEQFVSWYNQYDADLLISMIGDGEVVDAGLEPRGDGTYRSIAEWTEAAATVGDKIVLEGVGPGEPFMIFGHRTNPELADAGIEKLSLVVSIWSNPSCQTRVEVGGHISSPDPCAFSRQVDDIVGSCNQPLGPRMAHHAVWTGAEMILHGGASGTHSDDVLTSGLAYDPLDNTWRDIAPSPMAVASWPGADAYWTGKRMIVVGMVGEATASIRVLSYYPTEDRWTISDALPEQRYVGPGATAFSGTELFIFGGSQNDPRSTAWSFDLATNTWRQLPDPGIAEVEDPAGIWTGSEAVFYGGYTGGGNAVHVAYNPATGQWRDLPLDDEPWIDSHQLVWTGQEVIVVGGNIGPGHESQLRIFNYETEQWRRSTPLPVPSSDNPEPVWTGDRLILWGGHGTYGVFDDDGDAVYGSGAVYDPVADRWDVLPPSPLSDRCHHSGTWIDDGYLVFGGITVCGDPGLLATGTAATYQLETGHWRLLDRTG